MALQKGSSMNKIISDERITVVQTKIQGFTFRLMFSHLKPF